MNLRRAGLRGSAYLSRIVLSARATGFLPRCAPTAHWAVSENLGGQDLGGRAERETRTDPAPRAMLPRALALVARPSTPGFTSATRPEKRAIPSPTSSPPCRSPPPPPPHTPRPEPPERMGAPRSRVTGARLFNLLTCGADAPDVWQAEACVTDDQQTCCRMSTCVCV